MSTKDPGGDDRPRDARDGHAKLRFCVIAPLLSTPQHPGELQRKIRELSEQVWKHPDTGEHFRFSRSTIERWYYAALATDDPLEALRRRLRKDRGRTTMLSAAARELLRRQHREHPAWSVQLHRDNLAAAIERDPALGPAPSTSTVRRFFRAAGLVKQRRRKATTEGARRAQSRFERLEVRSFEQDHAGALWHLDFHIGSRSVTTRRGQRIRPVLLGVLDDCTRLVCHLQWYLAEDTESLVHGLCQAIQKRGLPRALMSDQGAAMTSAETRRGLLELGIAHELTLPYSPHQNGKQESFWNVVEGRLLAMLEDCEDLTLARLNELTQVWVDLDYHRRVHSELKGTPAERFRAAPSVLRAAPDAQALRRAFRRQESRRQRRSDGTVTVAGVRFEVPSAFGHLQRVTLGYAAFDLRDVDLVDAATGKVLARLRPVDKSRNADGRRRRRAASASNGSETAPETNSSTSSSPPQPSEPPASSGDRLPPLLRKLVDQAEARHLPPGFLPSPEPSSEDER